MPLDTLSLSDDKVFYTLEGEGLHIGQPSVFMHAADASHGDLGNIQQHDIV